MAVAVSAAMAARSMPSLGRKWLRTRNVDRKHRGLEKDPRGPHQPLAWKWTLAFGLVARSRTLVPSVAAPHDLYARNPLRHRSKIGLVDCEPALTSDRPLTDFFYFAGDAAAAVRHAADEQRRSTPGSEQPFLEMLRWGRIAPDAVPRWFDGA